MTTHLAIRDLYEAGRSYKIDAFEAERRGLPVIVVPEEPEIREDPRAAAETREGMFYRMARDIQAAKQLGVVQGCQLIALKVAYRSGMTLSELMVNSDLRGRVLSSVRHRACYGMRKGTGKSLPTIGRFLGVDHSSVSYGIAQHKKRLAAQAAFA
ncbi:helix-turn-helix domain-containing protein [Roseibium sp.]|uniref:helix-turn-helix domain-containing protein n=1 Tax=Roseibium sp. TaxID=1936156 RepID=UPI003B52D37B